MTRALIATAMMSTTAVAATVPAGAVGRPPNEVSRPEDAAFRQGASAALGATPAAPPAAPSARVTAALGQLEKGEDELLAARLRPAEKLLAQAFDGLLDADPPADAEAVSRAALLLAQVRAAIGRSDPDKVLERALRSIPRFPVGNADPPPEIAERVARLRTKLARELAATLEITSDPPGLPARLDGAAVGNTPVRLSGLPTRRVRVRVEPSDEPPREAVVDLSPGARVHLVLEGAPARAAVLERVAAGDREGALAAAARLETLTHADVTCVGLADDEGAVIARLAGHRQEVLGGERTPAAGDADGWRNLGRFCAATGAGSYAPDALASALWRSTEVVPPPVEETGSSRDTWGYVTLGLGVAAAGAGVYFGLQAQAAADDYHDAKTRAAANDARDTAKGDALVADVGFGLGAALVGTGLYLLISD